METFFTGVNGEIFRDNDGTSFNNEPIEFEWITKGFAEGDVFRNKSIDDIRFYGGYNGDVKLKTSIITEYFERGQVVLTENIVQEHFLTLQGDRV